MTGVFVLGENTS